MRMKNHSEDGLGDLVRGGRSAYGVAAQKAAAIANRELTDEQRRKAGSAIHWALGAGRGAAYGALRHRLPYADAGAGMLFGPAPGPSPGRPTHRGLPATSPLA